MGLSCRDKIDLAPQRDQLEGISIQGKLIKGNPSVALVEVERVFTFSGDSRKTLPIESVSIFDKAGNERFLSKNNSVSNFIGYIYPNQAPLSINYHQDYACRVVLSNGAIYESDFETLLPVPKIEGLEFEIIEKNIKNVILDKFEPAKFARFRVNTPLVVSNNPKKSNLRWVILRTYQQLNGANGATNSCIQSDFANFRHVDALNGSQVAGDFLKKYNFYDEYISFPFGLTYYLTVYQESLTDRAFSYWSEVETLTQQVGSQFEVAHGIVRSNFKNVNDAKEEVYGFFYATSRDVQHLRVCPKDLGFQPEVGRSTDFCNTPTVPDFWEICN
jgi:hypothetical protein